MSEGIAAQSFKNVQGVCTNVNAPSLVPGQAQTKRLNCGGNPVIARYSQGIHATARVVVAELDKAVFLASRMNASWS